MKPRALFLSPEDPVVGGGGGGIRSASLLAYLRERYEVDVVRFDLPPNSRSFTARAWRNTARAVRGVPPLFDRYSGHRLAIPGRDYAVAVVEHFWCAAYAETLRPLAKKLVLDLHNVESELARTQGLAARWTEAWLHRRFAASYKELEREWLPKFDLVLAASEDDARRISHRNVRVYPNALAWMDVPHVKEDPCILFSGNLEYHPNVEAVRWFNAEVWPSLRNRTTWRIVGRNSHAIRRIVAGDQGVEVVGEVEDAVREIAKARVVVVPLRSGSGTRFKILEAWAAKRAVVSTRIGAEGLAAEAGRELELADDAHRFAEAVERLLGDVERRGALGVAGRRTYEERYTWDAAWKALDGAL